VIKFLLGICAIACTSLQAQVPELEGFEAFMLEAIKFEQTPGAAVAVVSGDEVIYSKGFGVREVGKNDPVNSNTIFAIGSNSKYFTATAVGLLVEEGKLDWDQPLSRYLPQLRFSDSYLIPEITLRDALSHRTGLARADMAWKANSGESRDKILGMIEKLPRQIGLRSGYLYNNFMYVAAGESIPAVSDKSWDEVIKKRLFAPLKMTRSNTSVKDLVSMENVATPHVVIDGTVHPIPYYDVNHVAPAGAINSSVKDMAQWCKVQLADGKLFETQVIPQAVINEVRTPHSLLPLSREGLSGTIHNAYGLGIDRSNYGPYVLYAHTGGINGMLSRFMFIPEKQLCVVTLTNNENGYGLFNLAGEWVIDHMLGLADADKDYLAKLKTTYEIIKTYMGEFEAKHDSLDKAAKKPSLPLESYAGTYTNDVYGDVVINYLESNLRFEHGNEYTGILTHHSGDSFDLIYDAIAYKSMRPHLSFTLDSGGNIESVLAESIGGQERFYAQPKWPQ